jgi:hypothetical protein
VPKIIIKFVKSLEERGYGHFPTRYGVWFHRWLPDGEKDAIILESGHYDAKVKLWFARFGRVENGRIVYDEKLKEVDPDVMTKQGLLESGNLFGKIESFEITADELRILEEKKIGDKIYKDLGRKVSKIIDPILVKFFYILRIYFGQYWLPEFEKFNSKNESIGYHLRFLFMRWSKDDGKTWEEFDPDHEHPVISVTMSEGKSFFDLVTKADWENLKTILKEDHANSLAAITLARTHQYLVERDIRHAFFEGIIALELAIEEFIKTKLEGNKALNENIQGFWNMPIAARLISIAISIGASNTDIENTITAIKWRNLIVHEGWEPEFYPSKKNLFSLLRITAKLLQGPKFKFPDAGGNAIMPEESWEKEYLK